MFDYELCIHILLCQRAQPEELEKIKKHYEMSAEEDVKLLDKPEQSVSHLLTVNDCGYKTNTRLAVSSSETFCPLAPGSCTSCLRSQTSQAELTASSSSRPSSTGLRPSNASSKQSPLSARWGEKRRCKCVQMCRIGTKMYLILCVFSCF